MSYAAVTAHNAPPLSQQPHPDLGLLNTSNPHDETIPDVDKAHVTVVSHDFNTHPVTSTIVVEHSDDEEEEEGHSNVPGSAKRKVRKEKSQAEARQRQERVRRVERKVEGWAQWAKTVLFRPEVAGGFFAVVNIGVLGTVGYHVYQRPTLITKPGVNAKPLAIITGGLASLFAFEGWAAEQYLQTPAGQKELRRAEEEGHYLYNKAHEVVLRPQVAGGLIGLANLAVLSGLGWFTYVHWDTTLFSRRNVSLATVGLITWFSAQGYIVERYRQDHPEQWEKGKKEIEGLKKDWETEFGKLGEDHHPLTFSERLNAERVQRAVEQLEKSKRR